MIVTKPKKLANQKSDLLNGKPRRIAAQSLSISAVYKGMVEDFNYFFLITITKIADQKQCKKGLFPPTFWEEYDPSLWEGSMAGMEGDWSHCDHSWEAE